MMHRLSPGRDEELPLETHSSRADAEVRLRQQALIAQFGLYALEHDGVQDVLDEACRVAAAGMGTQFAKLLQHDARRDDFLVRAGVGWKPGVVGRVRVAADVGSAAGYAFKSGQPVISNELAKEDRFRMPPLLIEHGVRRAINVLVRGRGAPFGVLEADSPNGTAFTQRDIAFLQALGNTVAVVAERAQARAAQRQSEAFADSLLDASPDCVAVLDGEGRLTFLNANGAALLEASDAEALIGQDWAAVWPDGEAARIGRSIEQVRDGQLVRFEAFGPTLAGTPKWWDVTLFRIAGQPSLPGRFVAVSRDITDRMRAEAAADEASVAKDAALQEKDLLMQEVHHRVKNSLQLVQTLLNLQARSSENAEVQAQLREAASRVVTIGAVHHRLYQGGSVTESDAADYVSALLDDLQSSFAGIAEGRRVELDAEPMMLPADQLTPLGLVTTELVTNAVKYGAGRVRVQLRRQATGAELVVEDEGPGFPAGFEPSHGRGLGMRLILAMAKAGRDAITIDRSVAHGRVTCRLVLSPANP